MGNYCAHDPAEVVDRVANYDALGTVAVAALAERAYPVDRNCSAPAADAAAAAELVVLTVKLGDGPAANATVGRANLAERCPD